MEPADQVEIFRNKQITPGGNPLFPFQPVGMEIIIMIPFAQNFHFYCSHLHLASCAIMQGFLIYQWDCKFFAHMEKIFPFDMENFQNFKLKILCGKHPWFPYLIWIKSCTYQSWQFLVVAPICSAIPSSRVSVYSTERPKLLCQEQ